MVDINTLKATVSGNIIALRTAAHMTQLELGEKLSYSDKAVSKWERGESLPDVCVLKQLGELFGVTVDYLLCEHESTAEMPIHRARLRQNKLFVTLISATAVWAVALLVFSVLWILGHLEWLVFVYALPVSLIVLLVFNSIWGNTKHNFLIISALVWSIIALVYLTFVENNWWILFILGVPAEIIIYLCFKIRKKSDI